MDRETGRIYPDVDSVPADRRHAAMEMQVPPTLRQLTRMEVGRNDPCPCGSGKKFKRCCRMTKGDHP